MNKSSKGLIFWTPRILAILLILFIAMFSLDIFEMGGGIGQILLGLLMHNLWTIILIVLLILGWRWELVGAIGFIAFGLVSLGMRIGANPIALTLLGGFPLLIGALFLLGWYRGKLDRS